jgi:sterol 3beta-glucosyltransferase
MDKQSKSRPEDTVPLAAKGPDTSESPTNSVDPETDSSAAVQSFDESNVSASQILSGSDVFRAPAIHSRADTASETRNSKELQSQDRTRNEDSETSVPVSSPSQNPGNPDYKHSQAGKPTVELGTVVQKGPRPITSSSALQNLASYPLQKASGIAGFLRTRSKRVSGLLPTDSMGSYYEKVSGMLAGGRKHYNTGESSQMSVQAQGFEEDEDAAKAAEHFREHFAFPESEQLQCSFFASLQRVLPNYGKIYISNRYFCFRSLMPTSKTKV